MDHGFMQQYSIFCKPHFSTDHWAEATCPPLLFIVQYLWQGKKQDGAGTHCTHCHVLLYSDYVFNLLYRNCIDSAEFGQAEHWNLFCLDIQHQECLDFHLKKEREEKKEMQEQPHRMSFHHFAAYLSHLDTSFCSGVFPFWRRQAAFTMDMPESFLTVSSNERCFNKDCIYPDPVACVFMSLLDASPHLVI